MKKLFSIILSALLLAAMAVTAGANPANSDYTIVAEKGTPVIDGEVDDVWDSTTSVTQDIIRSGTDTGVRAEIRALYDDNYIYILEYVNDATLWGADLNLANYNYDTTEICMSLTNSASTSYDVTSDFWIGITPYGERNTDSNATALIGSGTDVNDAEYVDVATKVIGDEGSETGYFVEWAFNVKAIADLDMVPGTTIGFEVSTNDNAEYNNRTACIGWADASDGASTNPSVFGNLVLGGETSNVTEAEAEAEPEAEAEAETVTEPEVETVTETVAAPAEATPTEAPQTFDAGIIAAATAAVSAVGYAITKKRK